MSFKPTDWEINEENVFDFEHNIFFGFFFLKTKIWETINNTKINNYSDYLNIYIDIDTNISAAKKITVREIFKNVFKDTLHGNELI